MTKYWTILYSLTFTRTIPVSKDIDVGDYEPQVMEEIRTYKIRFLPIRKKIDYYSIDKNIETVVLCVYYYEVKIRLLRVQHFFLHFQAWQDRKLQQHKWALLHHQHMCCVDTKTSVLTHNLSHTCAAWIQRQLC